MIVARGREMRLIDNLEELKVGDFISTTLRMKEKVVYKIVATNDKVLQVEKMQHYRYSFSRDSYEEDYSDKVQDIIFKRVKKTKKKKLKHKVVTYNNEWVIFKLTDKERRIVIKKRILASLK